MATNSSFQLLSSFDDIPNLGLRFLEVSEPPLLPPPPSIEIISSEVTNYELISGGRNIKVTEENKHQYVDLVAEHRLTTAIHPQINAFLEGFTKLIPRELISIFNDKELELLISGLLNINLDDIRANTEYSGYSAASPVIQWFWKAPLEGFSALQGISGS
ncbi:hypothetical protein REPUB_Repub12eG0101100 [Reevesia pubescens]